MSESAIDRALTTQAILDQEHGLIVWADHRFRHDGRDEPAAASCSKASLTAPQADAAAAVAGQSDLVLVVGPAGTGKTTALAPAVAHLRAAGRPVFGVAPSAAAADVLSEGTGIIADTLDKLLIEHRLDRPPDHRYDLPVGATVIVDEAGMVSTAKLTELAILADTRGWRVALVGDPMQFSAVGRGGMFGLMVETFGAIELDRVHRFEHEWEREASLRLRRGDVEVAEIYDQHGRLHGGTVEQMERASVARWWEIRQEGKRELLVTPTNDATERLNLRCQQLRIRAGEVDSDGRSIDVGPYRIHVGDEIATRQNDRRLHTDRKDMVRNRAIWTVEALHSDGSLSATGKHGSVHLPARYVHEHVELAYARTVMASQGRNVYGGLLFADSPMDVRTTYVALSRGSRTNEAFFAVVGEQTALDVLVQSMTADWIDLPATSRQAELNETPPHRPGLLDGPVLRQLIGDRQAILAQLDSADSFLRRLPAAQRALEQDIAGARRTIAGADAEYRRADAVIDAHDRPLHRRKHEADLITARRELQRQPQIARRAEAAIEVAEHEMARLATQGARSQSTLDRRPELESTVAEIDGRLAHDRRVRTRIARLEVPDAIVNTLGPRPLDAQEAQQWDQEAGRLHQHQAAFAVQEDVGGRRGSPDRSAQPTSRPAVDRLRPPPTPDLGVPEIGLGL